MVLEQIRPLMCIFQIHITNVFMKQIHYDGGSNKKNIFLHLLTMLSNSMYAFLYCNPVKYVTMVNSCIISKTKYIPFPYFKVQPMHSTEYVKQTTTCQQTIKESVHFGSFPNTSVCKIISVSVNSNRPKIKHKRKRHKYKI
jgi:hypothetical protein